MRELMDGRMRAPDAAAYLGLAVHTLAMHRWRGTGPMFVKRGRIFYYRQDLDVWLRKGQMDSTTMPTKNIGMVELDGCRCRCGHEWLPRNGEHPFVCPKCKSPRWEKPLSDASTPASGAVK